MPRPGRGSRTTCGLLARIHHARPRGRRWYLRGRLRSALSALKVVLFEKSEQALQIAARDVEWHHLHDQVSLRRGDFFADDLGDGYDVASSLTFSACSAKTRISPLLSRVKAALADGGRVVIRDSMVDDSMVRPLSAAVFSVHMLVTSRQGRSYPSTEIKHWLRSVGFQDVHSVPQNPPTWS